MQQIDISIIIVHYRRLDLLLECLGSIYSSPSKCTFEVIVVDNDEKKLVEDKVRRKFPLITYVSSPGNIGYGAGNNLGANKANGKYLFILNPDTKVAKDTVDHLFAFLEGGTTTAVCAPSLLNLKEEIFTKLGSRTLTPKRAIFALSFINKLFPKNKISRDYFATDLDTKKIRYVDAVPGSAFMINKAVFEKVGRFDEQFFLYFEESDLGKRIRDKNFKIAILPNTFVVHHWKAASIDSKITSKIFMQSRFKYFKKHYGLPSALLVEVICRFSRKMVLLYLIVLTLIFIYAKK